MSASPRIRILWWEDRPDLGTGGMFAPLPPPPDPTEVEIVTASGYPDVRMTITHLPTRIRVAGSGPSQIKLRDALMAELARKVAERKADRP